MTSTTHCCHIVNFVGKCTCSAGQRRNPKGVAPTKVRKLSKLKEDEPCSSQTTLLWYHLFKEKSRASAQLRRTPLNSLMIKMKITSMLRLRETNNLLIALGHLSWSHNFDKAIVHASCHQDCCELKTLDLLKTEEIVFKYQVPFQLDTSHHKLCLNGVVSNQIL